MAERTVTISEERYDELKRAEAALRRNVAECDGDYLIGGDLAVVRRSDMASMRHYSELWRKYEEIATQGSFVQPTGQNLLELVADGKKWREMKERPVGPLMPAPEEWVKQEADAELGRLVRRLPEVCGESTLAKLLVSIKDDCPEWQVWFMDAFGSLSCHISRKPENAIRKALDAPPVSPDSGLSNAEYFNSPAPAEANACVPDIESENAPEPQYDPAFLRWRDDKWDGRGYDLADAFHAGRRLGRQEGASADAELGRLVRQMPVHRCLMNAGPQGWFITDSYGDFVTNTVPQTPEEALRAALEKK